jgi:Histidine kinase-, DNA gyrase B-, and HSP90-like ATPase
MKKSTLPPYAPSLIESIRSIGYSLETALADLIDNSITAGATNINIKFSPYGQPFVAILDDGEGMETDELAQAMRHGSKDPTFIREAHDLGRFGLGLKTASLSQCRRLIVTSLKNGVMSTMSWDLDVIIDEEDWVLLEYEEDDLVDLPLINDLRKQGNGTLVIWQDLDRIISGERSIESALGDKMDLVRDHLSLVFHRYLSGDYSVKRTKIQMNGYPLTPYDPFLISNPATELMPDEKVTLEGHVVEIKPYIIPHISKLSHEEIALAGGEEGLRKNQGFYIYRNKRLISWGTWFRLTKLSEMNKLARVRIDIPNSMDYLWDIDIKKSMATPPEAVRQNLKRIVDRIVNGSKRVYTFRGRKLRNENLIRLWDRYKGREGIWYQINRKHPIVESLMNKIGNEEKQELEQLLKSFEESYPIDSLYVDMASDVRIQMNPEINHLEHLKDLVGVLLKSVESIEGGKERMMEQLHLMDPFCNYPDFTKMLLEEIKNA